MSAEKSSGPPLQTDEMGSNTPPITMDSSKSSTQIKQESDCDAVTSSPEKDR